MVCLGPRKKEKKNASLSPEEGTTTSRSLKKSSSKLKIPKSNASIAPSIASSKKVIPRTSTESKRDPKTKLAVKESLLKKPSDLSAKKSSIPRPNTLSSGRSSSPVRRPVSPRPLSVSSVKNTSTSRPSSRNSTASIASTRKHPISEMKEEVKDLKAKNEENMKLIADQKAELELLKSQLGQQSSHTEEHHEPDEEFLQNLKEKEEQLLKREREIEELRVKLENQPPPPAIVIEDHHIKEEALAEREKELEEKEAQLQKRMLEEAHIEDVASQLELLKNENEDAVSRLASKEKELEELRLLIDEKGDTKEEDEKTLQQIDSLNKQLEIQKKAHEESLRLHEKALAEKDQLLKEQKDSLANLTLSHDEAVRKLKTQQTASILAIKKKHKQDKLDLEKQLEEAKQTAAADPSVDVDAELEKILHEFEQAEHTFTVQIQDLEQSHQDELEDLQVDQQEQINKLKEKQHEKRNTWSTRYIPTEAVSWPDPAKTVAMALPKLRSTPTPLVQSKSKTLLKVLGNMPGYQKPEPVLTPLDNTKVQVYYSSVSGNSVIKRNQENMQTILQQNNIKFSLVDVASSEAARQYAKKANNNGRSEGRIKEFPQLFVGGEYRGQYADLMQAIDDDQLSELLHPAEERVFSAEERAAIQKAELNEEMAGPVRSLPPMEALPVLRPTRSVNKPVRTLKDYDEDEELLKLLEEEMKQGKVNLDEL
ncbi:hypothetical protein BDB01DRAFT_908494 [Pilobolus umbonatus]|nr:hypothetical protein BDB01DRAFT_908494 [Pilobolus umbonatus]